MTRTAFPGSPEGDSPLSEKFADMISRNQTISQGMRNKLDAFGISRGRPNQGGARNVKPGALQGHASNQRSAMLKMLTKLQQGRKRRASFAETQRSDGVQDFAELLIGKGATGKFGGVPGRRGRFNGRTRFNRIGGHLRP
jgi:hypothetical protein